MVMRGETLKAVDQQDSRVVQDAVATVRSKLQSTLPQYMVPSAFLVLPEMPKTISKKTNRRGLRDIASSMSRQELLEAGAVGDRDKRPPRTIKERRLQELWSRALGMAPECIGMDDSFFDLGGDSVSALKLVSEARREKYTLSMADVFTEPTLAAQSKFGAIDIVGEVVRPFSLLRLEPDNLQKLRQEVAFSCGLPSAALEDVYPCSPLQAGLMSLTLKNPGDYILQNVLEVADDVQIEEFVAAWEETVRAVAILRTRIVQHADLGLLQSVVKAGIEWLRLPNERLKSYLEQDKDTPMDLGQPLSRWALVGRQGGEGGNATDAPRWLVWTVHHALFDGGSLPLVVDMVKAAYLNKTALSRRNFSPFIKYIQEASGDGADNYWRAALAGYDAAPFPPLPTSNHRPIADQITEKRCKIPAKGRSEATLSTIIRGALAALIHRHTDSLDAVFGAVLSGRNAPVDGMSSSVPPVLRC